MDQYVMVNCSGACCLCPKYVLNTCVPFSEFGGPALSASVRLGLEWSMIYLPNVNCEQHMGSDACRELVVCCPCWFGICFDDDGRQCIYDEVPTEKVSL
jgi:hypothetical protein